MPESPGTARLSIANTCRAPEAQLLPTLISLARTGVDTAAVRLQAARLVAQMRGPAENWIAGFLREYRLDSQEGLALLSLAEAYMRVPDSLSARELLRDKLGTKDWRGHAGESPSSLVNAATFGIVLAGALVRDHGGRLRALLKRTGVPFVERATAAALRLMARHFVLGETIAEALEEARQRELLCSFDMLGEGARTASDAERYFDSYAAAVAACSGSSGSNSLTACHSVSVKLSALHPRYEPLQAVRAVPKLTERLIALAERAAAGGIALTVDAEESDRLEMSLDIFERVARTPSLRNWEGLGLAVQAYQKRAPAVVDWIESLGAQTKRRFFVRLVKGAYWDTEIKRCQEHGLEDYPVWLRKQATDVSYLACAKRLLAGSHIYPAFATHNALTVATLLPWIGRRRDAEFQRLFGMGGGLYDRLATDEGIRCRVYAPVGGYRQLLAYLVRRMLENGANTSFIHQLGDATVTAEDLLADPVTVAVATLGRPYPSIPLPADLYGPARRNSRGLDLADRTVLASLRTLLSMSRSPDPEDKPAATTRADIQAAVAKAARVARDWEETGVGTRAGCLRRLADLVERDRDPLLRLLVHEGGKTRIDAVGEVREAVDFCRYYAQQAESLLVEQALPGPTGERNTLSLRGRGVFACISPWNFPLSIFLGQVAAALVTGNAVVAKAAPQTPRIAAHACRLAREAGVPDHVLELVRGGAEAGDALIADPHIQGVVFTGSTGTARRIAARLLSDSSRPLVPLIAETGGINPMIVDSTALTEQVCSDVIASAFQSAGQRCSSLRLLCLQEEIHGYTLEMLRGAMAELQTGDPADETTDIGPIIDGEAHARIEAYLQRMRHRILYASPLPHTLRGWFIAPTLVAVDDVDDLGEEVFGPVLHVVRWKAGDLETLVERLNRRGYGLTMGLHTRLDSTIDLVRRRARVGNLYVNRSMIGAVVEAQPFGGEGFSGTGPKAGGPHYLLRFCVERAVSVDTTAAGGNASLMNLGGG